MSNPELEKDLSPADIALMDDNTFSEMYGKTIDYRKTPSEIEPEPDIVDGNFITLPDDPTPEVDQETPEEFPEIPEESVQVPTEEQPYYASINDPDNWFEAITSKPIEVDGIKLDISDPSVVRNLIEKGAKSNLNQTNDLKFKRIVRSLDKNGIDTDTLNMIIAAYQGDKKAINKILGRNAITPTELDYYDYDTDYSNSSYDYLVSENDIKLDEIVKSLSSNDAKDRIDNFLQTLDRDSQEYVEKNPESYLALDKFMNSGLHDRILKAMEQSRLQNGFDNSVPDLEKYRSIAAVMIQQAEEQAESTKYDDSDSSYYNQNNKKSASLPRNRAFHKTEEKPQQLTPQEIAAMPDEDFLKYIK